MKTNSNVLHINAQFLDDGAPFPQPVENDTFQGETNLTINASNVGDRPIENEHSSNVLHSNPRVVEAAAIFEDGELKHDIDRCKICHEVRPVFQQAAHVEPKLNDNDLYSPVLWSVGDDGKCSRCCQEEINNRKRKNPSAAPKFSGIFTTYDDEVDCETIHNNMHFENIPPYLKNLSLLETAMISKITTITNITILKYGMLKGKGHFIAIPNDMKIAKTLPNLPQEVGIILLIVAVSVTCDRS